MAKDFKFMGSPMTEVKRTGTAPSKGSPPDAMCRRCNSAHRRIHRTVDFASKAFQVSALLHHPIEEKPVTNQRDLHCFG